MRRRIPLLALVAALALAGCAAPAPTPAPTAGTPTPPPPPGHVQPAGDPVAVATGLSLPWSIVRIAGDALVSQRDDARVVRIAADGATSEVGVVPGVAHGGEGGLLGLAALERDGEAWLYAYLTTADDNRIVRMTYARAGLGEPQVVLAGLERAGNHNGGRIAFGPDGMLYATVGDAGRPELAQDPASLNGKILRLTPEGDVPRDNPLAGSYVYSLGHRNPQGIAWDADGQLWSTEFGQNTWDELNRIEAGANYGWPVAEGAAGDDRFVDPVAQWSTAEASPSGLAYVDGTFFVAALRGERVWSVDLIDGRAEATAWFAGEFGRIRDVAAGPDGTLWFLTSNAGPRGVPRDGDDKLLQVRLVPWAEG